MDVLVSDKSVVIDLERAAILDYVFALPYRFVVPDVLYEQELRDYDGVTRYNSQYRWWLENHIGSARFGA